MKRGFKTAAKRLARDVRAELGLPHSMPFDPVAWAELYGIPLVCLDQLDCRPEVLANFRGSSSGRWSAALLPNGHGQVIVYNSAHAPARVRADLSHEAGHVLLEHPNVISVMNEQGCGPGELEQEANEVAGELLIPASAALRLARLRVSDQDVAAMYEISIRMARWRLNATGARLVAQRQHEAFWRTRIAR